MSFESISFGWTPPPTVLSPAPAATAASTVAASASSATGTSTNTSTAVSLAAQLQNLIDTATYLQNVIQSLNPGLGISVDASTNPDLAIALSQIYSGQAPPAVSLTMYGYMLNAELGCAQVNLAAGTDSTVTANPFQYQALLTSNKAFESQMASSGSFAAQSTTLLRRLKSDVVSNSNMQSALLTYPAATTSSSTSTSSQNVIPAATIDVGSTVASLVQDHIDQTGQIYSSMYQVLAQPDAIASDAASVVGVLATVAVPHLIRISSLLQMTQGGSLTPSVQGLSNGLSGFVYPQMLSQSSSMICQMDQIMQMAVTPASTMSNSAGAAVNLLSGAMTAAGALVGVIRSMKQASPVQTTGPLAGMPLNNSAVSGLAMSNPMPSSLSNLGFSGGVQELSSLLKFSTSNAQATNTLHQDAFQRLTARSRSDSSSLTSVLGAISSLTSLSSLVTAFINEQQNGSAISTQSSANQLAAVGSILASSQTGNGTTYTVQSGVISLTPPAVPAPTSSAQAVFAKSGIQTSLTGLTQSLQ